MNHLLRIVILSGFVSLLFNSVFSADVDTAWTRYYNGQANLTDRANAVVVDDSNNVYITGGSSAYGHTYNDFDVMTIKYSPGGDTLWERRLNTVGDNSEDGRFMALGGDGNIVIAGTTGAGTAATDIYIIKYSKDGDTLFTRMIHGTGTNSAFPVGLAVDDEGKIWVTGGTSNGSNEDILTANYDAAGTLLWSHQYNTSNHIDQVFDIVLDTAGNAYLAGAVDSSGKVDFLTIKYNSSGGVDWARRYDGPSGLIDRPAALAYDEQGYLYVSGYTQTVVMDNDVLIIKYNLAGDTIWTRIFDGPVNGPNVVYQAELDTSGNLYVAALMQVTGLDQRLGLLKCLPTGDTSWVRYFSPKVTVRDMEIDASGNVYITGDAVPPAALFYTDWVTIKFEPDGDTAWSRWLLDGILPSSFLVPHGLALDHAASVIVTGYIGSNPYTDYCTRKYTQTCCDLAGDANNDAGVNVGDAVFLINYVFKNGPPPDCGDEGDANADCALNVGDAVYLINHVFKSGPAAQCGCVGW